MKITKKIISLLLSLILSGTSLTVFAEPVSYSDYTESSLNELFYLSKYNIMQGYEDGTFRPDNFITRAEIAKMICAMYDIASGLPSMENADIKFPDVSYGHWAYEYITRASNGEIISGYDDGTFRPDEYVTYAETTKMLMSLLGYSQVAELYGGYPTGYMALAYSQFLFDSVDMSHQKENTYAKRSDIAKMFTMAMFIPICIITGYDLNGKGERIPKYSIGGDDIVVKTIFSLKNVTVAE